MKKVTTIETDLVGQRVQITMGMQNAAEHRDKSSRIDVWRLLGMFGKVNAVYLDKESGTPECLVSVADPDNVESPAGTLYRICATHLTLCRVAMAWILFAQAASAQVPHLAGGDFFTFSPPPIAPADLSWRLTNGVQSVELTANDIPYKGSQTAFLVDQLNAAQFGVDWPAWQAAVRDPAYNKSIMTFGGVAKETAFVNGWLPNYQLDRLHVFLDRYQPTNNSVDITYGAIDFLEVPEPGTWLLLAGMILWGANLRWRYER